MRRLILVIPGADHNGALVYFGFRPDAVEWYIAKRVSISQFCRAAIQERYDDGPGPIFLERLQARNPADAYDSSVDSFGAEVRRMIVKKLKTVLPFVLLLMLVFSFARLHAQDGDISGCDNSPENPTLILGFIASAGSIGFVQARKYLRNRNGSKNK